MYFVDKTKQKLDGANRYTMRLALVGGYRDLSVNYNKDGFLFDMSLNGPVLGFGIKF